MFDSVPCDHLRAYMYYTEAISNQNCTFWGRQRTVVDSALSIVSGGRLTKELVGEDKCTINSCLPFGLKSIDFPARGSFEVATSSSSPFCIHEEKVDDLMNDMLKSYKTEGTDKVTGIKGGKEYNFQPKLGRFETTFNNSYESQLAQHIKDLDDRLMGLSKKEFLKLAFDLAENLRIEHRFNKEKKYAGMDFYKSFMSRFPELGLRSPESTSLMRCVGFNKPQVNFFFEKLSFLMDKYHFAASRIYNADETGVSTVHQNPKVLSCKGKKQRMNPRLTIGAPDESIAAAQPNGWMSADTFLIWLKHFIKHTKPAPQNPVLLILDGHSSHKELTVINCARESNVHMISTPPHTTHKLQPLDRTFMKPFKAEYAEATAMWMRQNAGLRITENEISGLVSTAYAKSCRLDIARNGFSCTGIHSLNPGVFTENDFLPSLLTDIPEAQEGTAEPPLDELPADNTSRPAVEEQTPVQASEERNALSNSRSTPHVLKATPHHQTEAPALQMKALKHHSRKYEQKCFIKIQNVKDKNARQCHTALLEACGRETSPYRTVARWAHAFRNEREDVHQKRGAGRPQSASDDVHVNAGRALLEGHRFPAGNYENCAYCSYFLEHHLRPAVRHKRPNLLNSHPIVLYDGARSYIAAPVVDLLRRWNWDILEHPPYSPM
ncbi:hypothetical protein ANN_19467 [Periplaneta americana]|uniref:DDE-1 domain-containing protein n=1 Tax=Periplaneta americana TaxID=6978 RepID=A0ABQ8SAH0_PERAM|nr:hypothetical protein ANN_19467 [Periplaneta americana]